MRSLITVAIISAVTPWVVGCVTKKQQLGRLNPGLGHDRLEARVCPYQQAYQHAARTLQRRQRQPFHRVEWEQPPGGADAMADRAKVVFGGAGGNARARGNGATTVEKRDGSDDSVIARRSRHAGETQGDTELKRKLWKEYTDCLKNVQGAGKGGLRKEAGREDPRDGHAEARWSVAPRYVS